MVGAGLAGLVCAHRLRQAGVDVGVYEAWNRIGGRTFSLRGHYAHGQVAELGGELINSDHRTIRALAKELELPLDDLEAGDANLAAQLFYAGGRVVPESEIVELFRPVAAALQKAHEQAESGGDSLARIDSMTIADLLRDAKADPLLLTILDRAYTAEYGLEIDQQTALNLIYLIDWPNPEPFRILGDSDERYHVRGGNDQIASGGRRVVLLSAAVGRGSSR